MLSFLDKIKIGTPLIRRTVFWLLTAFIVYTLFGFFAVPPILEKVALSQIDANLHRKGEIGEVYFNPLTLYLRVDGFKIANREEEGDLVAFNSLEISPGASSVWELAPVISLLKIDGLAVNLTFYGEGRYSISDLLGSPEGQAPEETGDKKGTVFPFSLYGFELTNAHITFDDRPHNKKHVISEIFLRVPFTSSIPDKVKEFTQPKFTAVVNGDPIELKGRTLPFDKTLLTEFELGAVDINLNQYWKYVPIETPLALKGGRFTSDISLFFERTDDQRMNLFLGGGGTLSDLDLADPVRGSVFSMKKLVFEMERFSLGDNALIVKNVAMTRPFFKVVRKADGAINWVDYFPGSQAAPSGPKLKTKADNDAQFVLDIRKFELKEGTVDFEDQCVAGGFKHVFTPLDLTGEGISTRADRPSVFQGSLGTKGFLYLNGQATLEPVAAKFTVSGKDLSLPLLTPYINEAQPLILDSGKAGFSVDLDFSQPGGEPALTVANGSLKLTDLAVRKPDAKEPSLTLDALDVTGAAMDLAGRTIHADEVKLTGPSATVVRNKDGRLDLERLFAEAEKESDEAARAVGDEPETDAEPAADREQAPWVATVGRFALDDGSVDFRDLALTNPASLGVRKVLPRSERRHHGKGRDHTLLPGRRLDRRRLVLGQRQRLPRPAALLRLDQDRQAGAAAPGRLPGRGDRDAHRRRRGPREPVLHLCRGRDPGDHGQGRRGPERPQGQDHFRRHRDGGHRPAGRPVHRLRQRTGQAVRGRDQPERPARQGPLRQGGTAEHPPCPAHPGTSARARARRGQGSRQDQGRKDRGRDRDQGGAGARP